MKKTDFQSGEELLQICEQYGIGIAEAMQLREARMQECEPAAVREKMRGHVRVMKEAILRGLGRNTSTGAVPVRSASGLSGGDAVRLEQYAKGTPFLGQQACQAVAAAMATVEVNAAMGRIIAAPTAGASGILPGVLLSQADVRGWSEDDLIDGLFVAGAVGVLLAKNATISGADGGCQAETGSAAAMAAAALTFLCGGTPSMSLHAAAMAIKNILGLVCDPVAGLVECPCIKRNALGAANAMLCADLALAGIESMIPFDEVVSAMRSVGREMPASLRETARGGLAVTPTGKAVKRKMQNLPRSKEAGNEPNEE